MMALNVLKVFGLAAVSFVLAIAATPLLTHYLYKYKMWKKVPRLKESDKVERDIPSVASLDKGKEVGTPRMGGVLIWLSTTLVVLLVFVISKIFPSDITEKINFFSRSQTWLPLFTLISASLLGITDDILVIYGKGGYSSGGISLTKRIAIVLLIGLVGGFWFYNKLEVSSIAIPFVGEIGLGLLFVPIFMITMLVMFSGGVIDGIDGLSGGVFASMFSAYAGIAFFQNQVDLATFCAVLVGGILAFLWFNIPPARFYMGETGTLGLTTVLTVVAFLTGAVGVLPIIAFPLLAESGSDVIQLLSKKYFGKKVFLIAPIHHHFEAKGWPSYKVVMRAWVISAVLSIIGMVIHLVG